MARGGSRRAAGRGGRGAQIVEAYPVQVSAEQSLRLPQHQPRTVLSTQLRNEVYTQGGEAYEVPLDPHVPEGDSHVQQWKDPEQLQGRRQGHGQRPERQALVGRLAPISWLWRWKPASSLPSRGNRSRPYGPATCGADERGHAAARIAPRVSVQLRDDADVRRRTLGKQQVRAGFPSRAAGPDCVPGVLWVSAGLHPVRERHDTPSLPAEACCLLSLTSVVI